VALQFRPVSSENGAAMSALQEPTQPELPLPRGSLDYVSFSAHYRRGEGWELRTWHGHAGTLTTCERKDVYEGLTTEELCDVATAIMGSANSQWYLRGGICSPQVDTP
jgi:hypothetical protein